jgi:hypothetical protein
VVLRGPVATIEALARALDVPAASIIRGRRDEAMLTLWGATLDAYEKLKATGQVAVAHDQ